MAGKKQSEYSKRVKRLNERIADIARTFGRDSYYYTQMESTIKDFLREHPEQYHTSKSGNIAISAKKIDYAPLDHLLNIVENRYTKGAILSEAKKGLQRHGITKPTQAQLIEKAMEYDRINTFIQTHKDDRYEDDLEEFYQKQHQWSTQEVLNFINQYEEKEAQLRQKVIEYDPTEE